jgi:tetratricopeptide (TPR) repeat protein
MRKTVLLFLLVLCAAAAGVYYAPLDRLRPLSRAGRDLPLEAGARLQHPRVQDAAGILDPFASTLARMVDAFDTDLGIDVHVVTSTDPAGTIDEQAERLFRERGIGARAPTGGLLLLLNARLRRARIEVGYTLEGGLTDLQVGAIARDQLTPYAASDIAGMAVMDVLHYLRDLTYLAAARDEIKLRGEYGKDPRIAEYRKFYSGGAGARTALTAGADDVDLKQPIPEPRRSRYAPATTAQGSVEAYLRATAELAGDPSLELYTGGSRLMRASYPFAPYEELMRLERMRRSMPFTIEERGDFAVASSEHPVTGFVPILLRRDAMDPAQPDPAMLYWRIDAVETWKNLFFGRDGNYYLQNANTPYAFGLKAFGAAREMDIAPLDLGGRGTSDAIAGLETRSDVLSSLLRGEIWFRNAFVALRAFEAYEDALAAAPRDMLVLETLGRRALYLQLPDLAIPALKKMQHGAEWLLVQAYNQAGDPEQALAWADKGLDADPYDLDGLRWKEFLQNKAGRSDDARKTADTLAALLAEPDQPGRPVLLSFRPAVPEFDADTTRRIGGTTVYDHSDFAVTLTNTSRRAVTIESVRLFSEGNDRASGLGDIVKYWRYPSGGTRLEAGESVTFDKTWGFTIDTAHVHVRYVFRTCWRGEGERVRQCRTQSVDALPRWFAGSMRAQSG